MNKEMIQHLETLIGLQREGNELQRQTRDAARQQRDIMALTCKEIHRQGGDEDFELPEDLVCNECDPPPPPPETPVGEDDGGQP